MCEGKIKTAIISIGSNLNNRVENCRKGIDALAGLPDIEITGSSRFYQTAPVDYEDQEWFINTAIRIRTCLGPYKLLDQLKSIERELGRKESAIRFGPRNLDMDIILYNSEVINSKGLVIPHPRMHKRAFVLQPLCDIDPDIVHPVLKKDMRYLLNNVNDKKQKVLPYPC
jgi:2-amino-4-hydroxy-6-hydroxymethyldihydropteridine diphosphokinase